MSMNTGRTLVVAVAALTGLAGGVVALAATGAHAATMATVFVSPSGDDAGDGASAAPVPAGLNTRQLYVNGVRATRARGAAPVTLTWTPTGYTASGSAMSKWRNAGDIEFVYQGGLGAWTEIRCSVGRIGSDGTV